MPGLHWERHDGPVYFGGGTKYSGFYVTKAHFEYWLLVQRGSVWFLLCGKKEHEHEPRIDGEIIVQIDAEIIVQLQPDPITMSVPFKEASEWILNNPTKISAFYRQHNGPS